MKSLGHFSAAVLLVLLTGCVSTVASRIAEKSAVYRKLSVEQQERIARGMIRNGDSRDVVYIALGRPSDIEASSEPDGVEKWTYRNFYPSEQVAPESLYRKPSSEPEAVQTGSLDALGKTGLATDASSHGGYVESAGRASGSGGSGQADVSAATMEVWFRLGRVTSFRLSQ